MQKTTEELVFLEFEARQSLTVISAPPPLPRDKPTFNLRVAMAKIHVSGFYPYRFLSSYFKYPLNKKSEFIS